MLVVRLSFFIIVIGLHLTSLGAAENDSCCPEFLTQRAFDMDSVLGHWQIIETVHHEKISGLGFHNFTFTKKSCPTVDIKNETNGDLRILWNEEDFSFYYKARLDDSDHPGLWNASGPHNNIVAENHAILNFNGLIQVLKVIQDHLVLTFCTGQQTVNQRFSVLLARENSTPSPESIVSVRRLLERRGLDPVFIKRTCSGDAARITSILLLQMFFVAIWRLLV